MTREITKKEALAAFEGSASKLARALNISRQAVSKLEDGPVPELWRMKLVYELRPKLFGGDSGHKEAA